MYYEVWQRQRSVAFGQLPYDIYQSLPTVMAAFDTYDALKHLFNACMCYRPVIVLAHACGSNLVTF